MDDSDTVAGKGPNVNESITVDLMKKYESQFPIPEVNMEHSSSSFMDSDSQYIQRSFVVPNRKSTVDLNISRINKENETPNRDIELAHSQSIDHITKMKKFERDFRKSPERPKTAIDSNSKLNAIIEKEMQEEQVDTDSDANSEELDKSILTQATDEIDPKAKKENCWRTTKKVFAAPFNFLRKYTIFPSLETQMHTKMLIWYPVTAMAAAFFLTNHYMDLIPDTYIPIIAIAILCSLLLVPLFWFIHKKFDTKLLFAYTP